MPKRTNTLPNLRVDNVDLENSFHTYPLAVQNKTTERLFKDVFARVASGFRLQIDDATNRTVSVINGNAIRRDGQLISNEDAANTSRTISDLGGNATYYIEVEFTTTESDVDARAFWDPSYDNGADASGDILPDGREFSQNVSTRVTEDWQIVEPISTTEFELTSDPDSTRIPIAIVEVSGGVIAASATTSPARTTLLRDHPVSSQKLYVTDARLFPSSGTVTVGIGESSQEDVIFTSVDRDNHTITLQSPYLQQSHTRGFRVVMAGGSPDQFLDARTSQNPWLPTSVGDARPGLWQADEESGAVYAQNEAANTGFGDTQISNLKQYVDFLAAQVREMKFGAVSSTDIGNLAPPTSFSNPPRYFDQSGGSVAARAHTVSVGDGSSSWGDFNTTQVGTAQGALQAAHNALPAAGGVILLKEGTYQLVATSLTITKNTIIRGLGCTVSTIELTGAGLVDLQPAASASVGLENLSITQSGTSTAATAVEVTSWANTNHLHVLNCDIDGFKCDTAANELYNAVFESVRFEPADGLGTPFLGGVHTSSFRDCTFTNVTSSAGARAFLFAETSDQVTFDHCTLSAAAASVADYVVGVVGTSQTYLRFNGCTFSGGDSNTVAVVLENTLEHVYFTDCKSTCTHGFVYALDGFDHLHVTGCSVEFGDDTSGEAVIRLASPNAKFAKITRNYFVGVSGGLVGIWVSSGALDNSVVSHNEFSNIDVAFKFDVGIDETIISENDHQSSGGAAFIEGTALNDCTVANNRCEAYTKSQVTTKAFNFTATVSNSSFTGNLIKSVGETSGTNTLTYGMFFTNVTNCNVTGNKIGNVSTSPSGGTLYCIYVASNTTNSVFDGNVLYDSGVLLDQNTHGIYLTDDVRSTSISNNAFDGLGTSGSTLGQSCVYVGGDGSRAVTIANNTVQDFNVDAHSYVIHAASSCSQLSITGNTMYLADTQVSGIYIKNQLADTAPLENITIANNTVRGSGSGVIQNGIYVDLNDTTEYVDGRIAITGNVVSNCYVGIIVQSPSGAGNSYSLTVTGNVIHSISVNAQGIRIFDVETTTVVGNSLNLGGTGACQGILLDSAFYSTCSSNAIRMINASEQTGKAIEITATGSAYGTCTGNIVLTYTTGYSVDVSSNVYVVGNFIEATGAGDALFPTDSILSRARRNQEGNSVLDPTAWDEIGLNYLK